MKSINPLTTISPWARHFFIHVIKRSLAICIKWIDEMNEVNKEQETTNKRTLNQRNPMP